MKLTMAELIERSKPGYVYAITQEMIDSTPEDEHRWMLPGIDGPGNYTWNETERTYEPAVQPEPPQPAKQRGYDFDRGFGIGGLGRYEETPFIPTIRQIEQLEHLEATDTVCRRCGGSENFDGAMFTTDRSSGYCDDCYG